MDELTAEDHDAIRRAGEELHRQGWRAVFTLDQMMREWTWFVGAVERGYTYNVAEYANDNMCRDWLEKAWPLFTERVRTARQLELETLDTRFRAATREDVDNALQIRGFSGYWWQRRLPLRRIGAFAEDVGDLTD